MTERESFQEKIFSISTIERFNEVALELFQWQSVQNPVYRQYLSHLGVSPVSVSHYLDIPCLPVSFFKTQRISMLTEEQYRSSPYATAFKSSGTTQQERSTHWLYDVRWYDRILLAGFHRFFGAPSDYIVVACLPSYYDNKDSSLLYMVNRLIGESGHALSGYYDLMKEPLEPVLEACNRAGKKAWIIGVTYALLDWAESPNKKITLDGSAVIVETGGMKGRRRELVRAELHDRLKKGLGVETVYSEYGMCEMLSQAYSFEKEEFEPVPWLRFGLRELNDPFRNLSEGSGVVRVFDLANIDSCCFLETQDLGYMNTLGKLKILGRMDYSDIRGCNLLYQNPE